MCDIIKIINRLGIDKGEIEHQNLDEHQHLDNINYRKKTEVEKTNNKVY